MDKSMRELNHDLKKQVDKLACKLSEITEYILCSSACPIGNPSNCNAECDDPYEWKEWTKKDE